MLYIISSIRFTRRARWLVMMSLSLCCECTAHTLMFGCSFGWCWQTGLRSCNKYTCTPTCALPHERRAGTLAYLHTYIKAAKCPFGNLFLGDSARSFGMVRCDIPSHTLHRLETTFLLKNEGMRMFFFFVCFFVIELFISRLS